MRTRVIWQRGKRKDIETSCEKEVKALTQEVVGEYGSREDSIFMV